MGGRPVRLLRSVDAARRAVAALVGPDVPVLLPPNVWLENLSIEPGNQSVTFNGTAAEVEGRLPLATVAQLMKNLNESRYFRDASLSSTSEKMTDDVRGFSFALTVRYDPEAAATLPPTGLGTGGGPDAGSDTPADKKEGE